MTHWSLCVRRRGQIIDPESPAELARLPLRHPTARIYVRLVVKLIPRPHIGYLLDANPAQPSH